MGPLGLGKWIQQPGNESNNLEMNPTTWKTSSVSLHQLNPQNQPNRCLWKTAVHSGWVGSSPTNGRGSFILTIWWNITLRCLRQRCRRLAVKKIGTIIKWRCKKPHSSKKTALGEELDCFPPSKKNLSDRFFGVHRGFRDFFKGWLWHNFAIMMISQLDNYEKHIETSQFGHMKRGFVSEHHLSRFFSLKVTL